MKLLSSALILFFASLGVLDQMAHASDTKDQLPQIIEQVTIHNTAIEMPLGRLLLVRKDSNYCAIKFVDYWTEGKTHEDYYATYEAYYQTDKTGSFSNNNVKVIRKELSFPKPFGIGRLSFNPGNKELACGFVKLLWTGRGIVCFFGEGQKTADHGIELCPTKWTDISQVNVFNERLKWYRYDEQRKTATVPVEQLW